MEQINKGDNLKSLVPCSTNYEYHSLNRPFRNRSDVTQEIISRRPGFLEKWALLLFMIILFLLLAGTWFIRYPDIVEADGNLTSDNAPKEIIAMQTGRFIELFVHNDQKVREGEMIGWIGATANTKEVISLSGELDSSLILIEKGTPENISKLFKIHYEKLGELQISYQLFNTALQQYNDYLVNGFYVHKKEMLLRDLQSLQQMNASIVKQKNLSKQDVDSSQKSLTMNKYLFEQKIISAEEYRAENSKYLNKEMAIPQLEANLLSNQNQKREKLKELEQLEHNLSQEKITFVQALQTLKSSVDDWLRTYVIRAPLDGTVFFAIPLQRNKFVEKGQLLGYINPPDSKFYAELYLPQNNLGKVYVGMQVQLRFDAYPYQEFGFVKGTLTYISKVSSDSGFYATVKLIHGLQTNLKHSIQYKNGLKAQAIIITKNMRLLQRLYYSIEKSTSVGH